MQYREQNPFAGLNFNATPSIRELKIANLANKASEKASALGIESDVYKSLYGDTAGESNLIDALQYGIGRPLAELGDAIVDTSTRAVKEGYKVFGDMNEQQANEATLANMPNMPNMLNRSPYFDDNANFTGLDPYKTKAEYGFDSSVSDAAIREVENAKGFAETAKAIMTNIDAGPELFLSSSGEFALGALGKTKAFAALSAKYFNEILEERETTTGRVATGEERTALLPVAAAVALVGQLGDKALIGKIPAVNKLMKGIVGSGNKTASKSAIKEIAKKIVAGGTATIGQGVEEVFQDTLIAYGEKYGTKAQEELLSDQHIKELWGSFGGGVLGASPITGTQTAVGVAGSGAKGAVRTVGKGVEKGIDFAHKKAVEANYKIISQDQRDEIQATYKDNAAAYKKSEDANNAAASSIENTTTVDELKALNDPEVDVAIDSILDSDNKIKERRKSIYEAESTKDLEVDAWTIGKIAAINSSNESKVDYSLEELKDRLQAEITNSYTPADLNANIDKIKNEAIAQYNKRNTTDKLNLEAIRAKDFVYQASANLYDGTKAAVEKALPKELRDEIIKQAKAGVDLAKVGIDVATAELKNLDKSTARAMLDDLTKGKMHKGIDTFSRKQLGELKTAFKNNENATKVLNKAIERKNKISAEFDKVTKKDVKFFDAVVDMGGKIKNSNLAAQIRGLGIITEDFLTDSGNLSRAKSLVKELEKSKKEDPTKFSKEDQARLSDNKRKVLKAIRNEEQGAINNALRKIDKALTKNQVERRSIIALKQAKNKIISLSKKTYTSLEESELLKNLNKSLEDLSKKLEEYGDDVDVAPEAKAKSKKSTTEKVDVTEDTIKVVNSSEVSEKELAEILEDSSTIEADNEVSTAPDKPLNGKLAKEANIDLLVSMFCNKG